MMTNALSQEDNEPKQRDELDGEKPKEATDLGDTIDDEKDGQKRQNSNINIEAYQAYYNTNEVNPQASQ